MASGAPTPGGQKILPPGGHQRIAPGGVDMSGNNYRKFQGHADFDISPAGNRSGARVNQIRSAVNIRRPARTTAVAFNWTLPTRPGGSTATVANGTTATANFTPDVAGTYVFRCVVTFTGSGQTVTKEVTYVSA